MEFDYLNIAGNISYFIALWILVGLIFGAIQQQLWSSLFVKESYSRLARRGFLVVIEIMIQQPWLHNKSTED